MKEQQEEDQWCVCAWRAYLRGKLSDRVGKIAEADVLMLCGIVPGKARRNQVKRDRSERVRLAMRELGWERARLRSDGFVQNCYVRGTSTQRKGQLVVEYDPQRRQVFVETGTRV